mmetsp:Transcript_1131/g.2294  ORF Transcript_1131/g.2294 Transcript_1131/m.2294 type:complete len:424 (-) Transcript_1131:22-1293(-)
MADSDTTYKKTYAAGIDWTTAKHVAAFSMAVPSGAIMSFYTAFAGYYGRQFESRAFFLVCLAASYMMFPFVGWLQQRCDAYYDRSYGTKAAWMLRVMVMPTVQATCILIWIALPQTPITVLVAGGLLGFTAAVGTSSAAQLIAAMDPECLAAVEMGNLSGSALPIIVFTLTGFGPESTLNHFKAINILLAVVCITTSLVHAYFHLSMDLYAQAFQRLQYDLHDDERDDMMPVMGMARQDTETQPLLADGEAKDWLWNWSGILGLNSSLAFFSLALCTFVGGMGLAQKLALQKLAADFTSGLIGIVWRGMEITVPQHYAVAAITFLRMCLFVPLTQVLVVPGSLSRTQLLTAWALYHGLFTLLKTMVGVTTARYSPVSERKATARRNFTFLFTGIFVGLLSAALFVASAFGIDNHWPSWTKVID